MTTYDFNKFCSFIDNFTVTIKDALSICKDKKVIENFLEISTALYDKHHLKTEDISYFDNDHILISGKMDSLKPLIDDLKTLLDSLD